MSDVFWICLTVFSVVMLGCMIFDNYMTHMENLYELKNNKEKTNGK